MKFHIGDRVCCARESTPEGRKCFGLTGTVRDIPMGSWVGVEWDERRDGFHRLAGRLDSETGYNVPSRDLDLIDEWFDDVSIDEAVLSKLLCEEV